jgi:hypothetical protein
MTGIRLGGRPAKEAQQDDEHPDPTAPDHLMEDGRTMRRVLLLAAVVLLSACGPLIVTEVSEADPGECQDVTAAWSADLAGVTQGAGSPEEALDARRHEDPGDMPAGEPTREAGDDMSVRYVFAASGNYTGNATVIRLEDGWTVESASRCAHRAPADADAAS